MRPNLNSATEIHIRKPKKMKGMVIKRKTNKQTNKQTKSSTLEGNANHCTNTFFSLVLSFNSGSEKNTNPVNPMSVEDQLSR